MIPITEISECNASVIFFIKTDKVAWEHKAGQNRKYDQKTNRTNAFSTSNGGPGKGAELEVMKLKVA